MMRVAVVHHAVQSGDGPEDKNVLDQAEVVGSALETLGHRVDFLSCSLNLKDIQDRIEACLPDIVFNLVECLGGKGRLIHLFPFFLDAIEMPYTGCSAESVLETSNKIIAKTSMNALGLPTPGWVGPYPGGPWDRIQGEENGSISETTWIIKSVWEHASIGLDDTCLVRAASEHGLHQLTALRAPALGGACFCERFICGREFNLSLLGGSGGPQVLPPAEIIFHNFGPEKPRIVGYRAKWDTASPEYHQTLRRFEFGPEDDGLLNRLSDLALTCWQAFGLAGYARVDFRVDADSRPWILEINANPCLSADAGFVAALTHAGLSFPQAVERILCDTLERRSSVKLAQTQTARATPEPLAGNRRAQHASNSPHL